jgi:hypothetical protein
MSNRKINQRLEDLQNVLFYCSELQKEGKIYVFKVGERICINQERGSLFSQLSFDNNENFLHEVRGYECPPALEAKIKFTIEKIKATNWGGFNQDQFLK